MKVLIYGHKGWIGGQVIEILQKINHDIILGKSRVENKEGVEKELLETNPTHVMSFIGRTHGKIGDKEYTTIDYLEQKGKIKDNVRDNLFSPVVLALLCKKYDIHYTYLGTGCIFNTDTVNDINNKIDENGKPNFFGSSYSVVKGYTDELMHILDSHCLNIRIRMPITGESNPRNFITKITKYKKICSIPNSMTVLPELLPIMIDMSEKKVTGTINLTNPGLISHNEILEMYKEYVDKDFVWENFTIEEQSEILAAERSNNFLDTTKLEKMYPEVKNIRDSVKELMIKYKM